MIHFLFLASLFLVSVFTLSWDWIIVKEHVEKLHTETSLIEQNSVMGITLYPLSLFSHFLSLYFSFLGITKFKLLIDND